MTGNNPKLDLVNVDVHTKFGQILSICSQDTVQLSRCFERSRNAQIFLIPSKNVLRVTRASLVSDSRVTRKFYIIQFASDAQSSFGSSRIPHGSLRDA